MPARTPTIPWADSAVRRARLLTLVWLASSVVSTVFMPAVGLARETSATRVTAGVVGVALFFSAQSAAVWATMTPWAARRTHRWGVVGFAVASVVSVPLLAPVANGSWPTWAWVGAAVVGTSPLVWRPLSAVAVSVLAVAVSIALAPFVDGSVRENVLVTAGVGAAIALVNRAPVWLWELLVQAEGGRSAQARLTASEERLRFARDVHDMLGHDLTVIGLRAELAARTASSDPVTAASEAEAVRHLAAEALDRVRAAVFAYRAPDLLAEVAAMADLLAASGVRCDSEVSDVGVSDDTPSRLGTEATAQLAMVLREATTNVLRHSRATWCQITLSTAGDDLVLAIVNDGSHGSGLDAHSFGLRGMADRLVEIGGSLRTDDRDGIFTLTASVQTSSGVW